MRQAERKFVVFASLVGVLMLTSALLLALAPAPLAPDARNTLLAVEAPGALDSIFQTGVQGKPGQWKYIYIHHSKTTGGNASTLGDPSVGLADHFLIGNGEGTVDGEIQWSMRWHQQEPAARHADLAKLDPACISICLVGDFDHALPTASQMRSLTRLVGTLQLNLGISEQNVILQNQPSTPAAAGRYFPTAAFREQLVR